MLIRQLDLSLKEEDQLLKMFQCYHFDMKSILSLFGNSDYQQLVYHLQQQMIHNGIKTEQMYEYFDKDGDSSLTYNELKFGIYRLNLNIDSYVIDYFVK